MGECASLLMEGVEEVLIMLFLMCNKQPKPSTDRSFGTAQSDTA